MSGIKMEKIDNENLETKVKTIVEKPVAQEISKEDIPIGFYPIKDLPSRYKLYPEGTMIYGRPLRVLEVKQLSQMGEGNATQVINSVLKSSIRGINIDDLLIADKIYILFWLRANTYKESGYRVNFHCLECNSDSDYVFSLESLDVTYIDDNFKSYTPIELPIKKDKIVFRYQRISDANDVENLQAKVIGNPLEEYDDDILNTASTIISINENTKMSLKEKYLYIIGLDAGDFAYLENNKNLKDIGVSTVIKVKCSKCEKLSFAGLSFRSDFFIPKYKT